MKTVFIVLMLVAGACVDALPELPHVRLVSPGVDPPPVLAPVLEGACAWEALGFTVGEDESGLVECYLGWTADMDPKCQMTIGVIMTPGVTPHSRRAVRTMWLDPTASDDHLSIAAAHETGHVVLYTSTHTSGGVMGGDASSLWPVDYQLACETIHVCLEGAHALP